MHQRRLPSAVLCALHHIQGKVETHHNVSPGKQKPDYILSSSISSTYTRQGTLKGGHFFSYLHLLHSFIIGRSISMMSLLKLPMNQFSTGIKCYLSVFICVLPLKVQICCAVAMIGSSFDSCYCNQIIFLFPLNDLVL